MSQPRTQRSKRMYYAAYSASLRERLRRLFQSNGSVARCAIKSFLIIDHRKKSVNGGESSVESPLTDRLWRILPR